MLENRDQQQRITECFSFLTTADEDFRTKFFNSATYVRIPAGHTIASEGNDCQQLALLLSGKVRVYKLAENGREITLYRINSGDSCVLTASCIISDTAFPAIAVTESEVEAIVIPSKHAYEWTGDYKSWSFFIFSLIAKRMADVIALLEKVAFRRMDERIAAYLIAMASQGEDITITHQGIAYDLGTGREVVSRILKDFEGKGFIKATRNNIIIEDFSGLQAYQK